MASITGGMSGVCLCLLTLCHNVCLTLLKRKEVCWNCSQPSIKEAKRKMIVRLCCKSTFCLPFSFLWLKAAASRENAMLCWQDRGSCVWNSKVSVKAVIFRGMQILCWLGSRLNCCSSPKKPAKRQTCLQLYLSLDFKGHKNKLKFYFFNFPPQCPSVALFSALAPFYIRTRCNARKNPILLGGYLPPLSKCHPDPQYPAEHVVRLALVACYINKYY